MEDESRKSDDNNSSSDSDSDQVEWLAKGRSRRSTAGNHMSSLLDAEADDDLALLFAEEEEDEEFESAPEGGVEGEGEGGDEADDMELESSSDDEDQGPDAAGGDDDLEGEKELQAEAKRLAKKRKAQQEGLRFTALRKKVKIDPTAGGRTQTIPAPRPKKKSERVSWLPTPEDGPTRSSSRRQTMQNKELTHARLKDSEQKRVRLIATMEEAAKRKEKLKPKQMTQADRLAEAAKTERLNSKSLNRWEEMEKRRSEEQKAKLEALQSRRLEGAVATSWSGMAEWVDGRLVKVGSKEVARVPEKGHGRKNKEGKGKEKDKEKGRDGVDSGSPEVTREKKAENDVKGPGTTAAAPPVKAEQQSQDGPKQFTFAPPQGPESFLDGIHLYASMNEEGQSVPAVAAPPAPVATQPTPPQAAPVQAPSQSPYPTEKQQPPSQTTSQSEKPPQPQQPAIEPSKPQALTPAPAPAPTTTTTTTATPTSYPTILPAKPPTPPPPKIEHSSRNLMVLENFESRATQERNEYSIFFNSRKAPKLQKPPQETCPITSRPARYRDPHTLLPYANSLAYREIRNTLSHRYAWSGLLGCFVGPIGVGARGVPERFLAPNMPPPGMGGGSGSSTVGTGTKTPGGGGVASGVQQAVGGTAGATAGEAVVVKS